MPPIRLQPRTCSLPVAVIKKTNAGSATRTFCSSRVILAGAGQGRQAGYRPLVCGAKKIEKIPARSSLLRTLGSGVRGYATATPADAVIEELTEQYSVAMDESELAWQEIENHSAFAANDRAAAVEEFFKLKEMYEHAIKGEHRVEVKRRMGQKIRKLEQATKMLEDMELEDTDYLEDYLEDMDLEDTDLKDTDSDK
ncbi:hypothetical protein SBOR_3685 [Sclerotinia borealis F-4128]|uniref:Uncharacterized protein n=1 Tax=Sclerotinia borealis (strain F-4128) TaxID=1432307 RepID=W9CGN0_SCLBF|nr:hypothetical protein SBOR_3685 [Sclerotinia borealis F-4128]